MTYIQRIMTHASIWLFGTVVGITGYQFIKLISKSVLIDTFNIPTAELQVYEPYAFVIFVVMIAILIVILIKKNNYLPNTPNKEITNELKEDSYSDEDYRKIADLYNRKIAEDLKQSPKSYFDIANQHSKTVYAITGGWRAGKTSAAGMLVNHIRNKKKEQILSETYHDTFNFGNIDESITSFFESLAHKTGISEFKDLGRVSSPGLDMNVNLGPVSIKRTLSTQNSPNEIRASIFQSLCKQQGIHLIIIDDIDRLVATDQVQWLKVIELLGKFQSKLVLIIPVHIDEVAYRLEDLKFSRHYIDKILPNKYPIGVDVAFVKMQFFSKNSVTQRNKRLYAKYLLSLAIRESLSVLGSYRVTHRDEWTNFLEANGISGIAKHLKNKLAILEDQITQDNGKFISVADEKEVTRINSFTINKLINSGFLISSTYAGAEPILGDRDWNTLRSLHSLKILFGNYKLVEHDQLNKEYILSAEGANYWTEYIWPVIADLETDPNLSSQFTYKLIDEEISLLLKTKSVEEERDLLIRFVLDWQFQNFRSGGA